MCGRRCAPERRFGKTIRLERATRPPMTDTRRAAAPASASVPAGPLSLAAAAESWSSGRAARLDSRQMEGGVNRPTFACLSNHSIAAAAFWE
jgi:hypothetical protein